MSFDPKKDNNLTVSEVGNTFEYTNCKFSHLEKRPEPIDQWVSSDFVDKAGSKDLEVATKMNC